LRKKEPLHKRPSFEKILTSRLDYLSKNFVLALTFVYSSYLIYPEVQTIESLRTWSTFHVSIIIQKKEKFVKP